MKYAGLVVMLVAMLLSAGAAEAVVTLDMVTVGDAGNTETMVVDNGGSFWWPDPTAGAVDYVYEIGTTEVTAGQYVEFMNSNIATVDAYELYSSQMGNADGCGITFSGGVYVAADANVAANYVSWGQAARFANWMHNGQVAGGTETGAYALNGAITDPTIAAVAMAGRDAGATFFLPSLDEWVKAAYYNPIGGYYYAYPTQSNTPPTPAVSGAGDNLAVLDGSGATAPIAVGTLTGTTSPYGSYDMAGNVNEFIETTVTLYGEGISMMMGNAWATPLSGNAYHWVHTNHDNHNDRRAGFRLAAPGEAEGVEGDFDGDGDVDADDIDILCANMGGDLDPYDVDSSGVVDEDDMIFHVENLVEYDTDQDGTADGAGTYRGDFNLDGVVNATDLQIMKGSFGSSGVGYASGNANCDTVVNATDLQILKGAFGSSASGVPEPLTVGLLALGGAALLRRRSR